MNGSDYKPHFVRKPEPGEGDDVACFACGARALDTGLECAECGADNYEAVTGKPRRPTAGRWTTMAEEQMRAEFEAWCESPGSHDLGRLLTAVKTEALQMALTRAAFEGWKGRAALAPSPAPVADDPIRQLGQEMLRITTTVVGLSLEDACAVIPELWLHCMRERDELRAAQVAVAGQGEALRKIADMGTQESHPGHHGGALHLRCNGCSYRWCPSVEGERHAADCPVVIARDALRATPASPAPHKGAKPVAFMRSVDADTIERAVWSAAAVAHFKKIGQHADDFDVPLYAAPQEHEARDAAVLREALLRIERECPAAHPARGIATEALYRAARAVKGDRT